MELEIEKLKNLYRQIGDHLKNHFQGFESYIFTGNLQLLKSIGLRTKRKFILKNGMIDCRLAYYPLQKVNINIIFTKKCIKFK